MKDFVNCKYSNHLFTLTSLPCRLSLILKVPKITPFKLLYDSSSFCNFVPIIYKNIHIEQHIRRQHNNNKHFYFEKTTTYFHHYGQFQRIRFNKRATQINPSHHLHESRNFCRRQCLPRESAVFFGATLPRSAVNSVGTKFGLCRWQQFSSTSSKRRFFVFYQ